jgi:hypothetical protein
MKVLLFEVCSRPEILKPNTEAMVLSQCFANLGIEFELYSNDGFWTDRPKAGATINRDLIQHRLGDSSIDVVHFAVHGTRMGMILKWGGPINKRFAVDVLAAPEIRAMGEFHNKLVVSGACSSAWLANDFLCAGATAVVAPEAAIPWKNLGIFFQSFYSLLKAGSAVKVALASAISGHPELASYQVYS